MNALILALVVIIAVCVAVIFAARGGMNKASREEGARFRRVGDGLKELEEKKKRFSHLTAEILAETGDDGLLECVLSNLWSKMRPDLSNAYEIVSPMSPGRRLVYSLYAVTGSLKQDGVKKFFKSPDARFMPEALSALQPLEASDVRSALSALESGENSSAAPYLEAFDALDVKARMVAYIRAHTEEFVD